jgi:hypothetical protein
MTSTRGAASAHNLSLVGHIDFDGRGDGMHINVVDGYAYFGHQKGTGTSIVDVRDPRDPKLVTRIPAPPNSHSHKVQVVGDLLLVNRERLEPADAVPGSWTAGLSVFDVSDPADPREIGFWSCGGRGVHRMAYWEAPYAFVTAGSGEFEFKQQYLVILDLSDPTDPVAVGRWWFPGMRPEEADQRWWAPDRLAKLHHAVPHGDRLYCGWWDLGVVILDIEDVSSPRLVGNLSFDEIDPPSRQTHSVVPLLGRDALVVTDEATERFGVDVQARIVDIADETEPRLVSRFPVPEGDYRAQPLRFGPHNVHEPRPGSLQRNDLVFMTYFNAGLRVFDVSDLASPHEVAHFVPETPAGQPAIQMNDVFVAPDGLIYASDRVTGGMYILEMDDSLA